MEYFPSVVLDEIKRLNGNLENLNNQIKEFSKTSNKLQKWLIFWTAVMAFAVLGQIITIILTSIY